MATKQSYLPSRDVLDRYQLTVPDQYLALYYDLETVAWLLAVQLWGVADYLTTWYSMESGAGYESTEIVSTIILNYGHMGHFGFKLGVFAAAGLLAYAIPRPYRIAVPIGFLVAGAILTINNALVIVSAL